MNKKKVKSYLLFQLLIQTTPKPCQLLKTPWKTSDQMRNALKMVKFINGTQQSPNLGRILRKISLSSCNSNSGVKHCGKIFCLWPTYQGIYRTHFQIR